MTRLWRNRTDTPEGKYLVTRRDGTVPEWPSFVLGAKDPAAPAALRAYARAAQQEGYDVEFVKDIFDLADEFDLYRQTYGPGDPDAPPHRKDDPAIIRKMQTGRGS